MTLTATLRQRWDGKDYQFLIDGDSGLTIDEVFCQPIDHLAPIRTGDVVALIGDFDRRSIADLLALIDKGAIVVPLTTLTRVDHEYFFEAALVDWVVEDGTTTARPHRETHPLLMKLRERRNPGLVLFSTGTTGRPKAILHDLTFFLRRFETPRPTLRTMGFLLFDHIGGLNTLLHTIFNAGVVVAPADRSVKGVLATCEKHAVEVLPTTPTFLRMMLMSGLVPDAVPESLDIITYGTERMDQPTLSQLCELLPSVDFRQTFGMSELGIVRAKSEARDSLYMRIGGEGVETRIVHGVLEIRSASRMMGYLNASSPFDDQGWYNTGDIVERDGDFIKVIGRTTEVINVGGLKFMASEVERVVLQFPDIELAKVLAHQNPITGEHVELLVQPVGEVPLDRDALFAFLVDRLPEHMRPRRIRTSQVAVGHRFKRV